MNGTNMMRTFKTRINYVQELAEKNVMILGCAVAALALLGGGFYVYRYLGIQKEQAAHVILADCLSHYDQAAQGRAQWTDVVSMCQAGYEKFSATKVAPYILAVEVDALLAQQKQEEAIQKLDLMILRIGHDSPLYPLYKLKHALLKLDLPDTTTDKELALKDLEILADDANNIYKDAAQFYLGYYYRTHNNDQKAKEVWSSLITLNEGLADEQARSPWAAMAQEKMIGLS